MTARIFIILSLTGVLLVPLMLLSTAPACCPAPPSGRPVVNADQTVILIWDPATKTEHFIRKASFKSEADDFGFLVPTPAQPELQESGNEAFPFLQKLTEPEILKMARPSGNINCGCGSIGPKNSPAGRSAALSEVKVLEEKLVAGFNAVVLETRSANDLVRWLKDHGYAFSPEVEAWAKPYVEGGWKITALKVAKSKDAKEKNDLTASALRLSFKTDRPLFPYREPDPKKDAAALAAKARLLRIYFLSDARYKGELTKEVAWTGNVAWANKVNSEDKKKVLGMLKLPEIAGSEELWLTEYEHDWPYRVAPADVYFSRDANQSTVKRPPIIQYVSNPWPNDVTGYALAALLILPPTVRKLRRGTKNQVASAPG